MAKALRVDFAGVVQAPSPLTDGSVRVPARIARTGVLEYDMGDGTVRREYRPPEEVFSPTSLGTWDGLALTILHPVVPVHPGNWSELAKGHVSGPKQDGQFVGADCIVKDATALDLVGAGALVEISCGYFMDYDPTPGVSPEGEPYDGIQRNIVGNHVALGPKDWGRSGADVRLYVGDSKAGVAVRASGYAKDMATEQPSTSQTTVEKVVPLAEFERVSAESDALKIELANANSAKDAAIASADSRAEKRVAIVVAALKAVPTLDCKGKTDRQIMAEAIAASDPTFKADGRSDDYLMARMDMIPSVRSDSASKALTEQAATMTQDAGKQGGNLVADARNAWITKQANAWKQPLGK